MSDSADYRRIMSSALGADLDVKEAEALAAAMTVHNLEPGTVYIEEGQSDHALHLLVSGKMEVSRVGPEGQASVVHLMYPGEFSGVLGFLDGTPRTATLRASAESEVYSLERPGLESLLASNPRIAYKILRSLVRNAYNIIETMNRQTEQLTGYFFKQGGRY